jgi:hypothetical protein
MVTSLMQLALLLWPTIFLLPFCGGKVVKSYWLCLLVLSACSGRVFLLWVLSWQGFSRKVTSSHSFDYQSCFVYLRGSVVGGTAFDPEIRKPVLILDLLLSSCATLALELSFLTCKIGVRWDHLKVLKCWTSIEMTPILFIIWRSQWTLIWII